MLRSGAAATSVSGEVIADIVPDVSEEAGNWHHIRTSRVLTTPKWEWNVIHSSKMNDPLAVKKSIDPYLSQLD